MKIPAIVLTALLSTSCLALTGPPEEVGDGIVAALAEGDTERAAYMYDRIERDPEYREQIYPTLFDAARDRYIGNDFEGAADVLRFMLPRYPQAMAVKEAMAYSLFLQRASTGRADGARELEELLESLGNRPIGSSPWIALVETQVAIDRGDDAAALDGFDRFLAHWNGGPAELAVYVDDLGRYLTSRSSLASAGGGR